MRGVGYFFDGLSLVFTPGIRRFVFIPLLINLVLFAGLTYWVLQQFDGWTAFLLSMLPEFMVKYASWLVSFVLGAFILVSAGYSFSIVANFIAAPFNGFLAERIEIAASGSGPAPEPLGKMIVRTFFREVEKLIYFIPRAIAVFVAALMLSFVPLINFFAPLLPLIWGAWSLAIQYTDYAFDNHQTPFKDVRVAMRSNLSDTLSFGAVVMFVTTIPLANLLVIPVAVTGASLYYVKQFKGRS